MAVNFFWNFADTEVPSGRPSGLYRGWGYPPTSRTCAYGVQFLRPPTCPPAWPFTRCGAVRRLRARQVARRSRAQNISVRRASGNISAGRRGSTLGARSPWCSRQRPAGIALAHPKATGMSDAAIAEHCGVSREMVNDNRPKPLGIIPSQPAKRTGRDGRTINTANIGRGKRPCNSTTNYFASSRRFYLTSKPKRIG